MAGRNSAVLSLVLFAFARPITMCLFASFVDSTCEHIDYSLNDTCRYTHRYGQWGQEPFPWGQHLLGTPARKRVLVDTTEDTTMTYANDRSPV
ncbi:hypothetical protein EDB85DRAFT_2009301 [Lactarius pseudohatsudake]|nr:hypothetical protein EDB85DRAFT_2009301 [Lactarius pseudohatsudake]